MCKVCDGKHQGWDHCICEDGMMNNFSECEPLQDVLDGVLRKLKQGDQIVIRLKGQVSVIDILDRGISIAGPIKEQIGG